MGRRTLIRRGHPVPKTGQGLRAVRLNPGRLPHRRFRLFHAQKGRYIRRKCITPSNPAPHFYLELIRQRLTNPTLEFEAKNIELVGASEHNGGIYVAMKLPFLITNVGRTAAYNWQLTIK